MPDQQSNISEPEKIALYLRECERMSAGKMSDKASSKDFFELWESIQHPQPFFSTETFLDLGNGIRISLAEFQPDGADLRVRWDIQSSAPVLICHGGTAKKTVSFHFVGGKTFLTESKLSVADQESAGGDSSRYYDIARNTVLYLRGQGIDLSSGKIRKKDFTNALDLCSADFPKKLISETKALSLEVIRTLVKQICADLPEDELSDQLSLPLDGSYAQTETVSENDCLLNRPVTARHRETQWECVRKLRYLAEAARLMTEFERNFELDFSEAELLEKQNANLLLSLHPATGAPVRAEDLFQMTYNGTPFGVFTVDIFDGVEVIGHWAPPEEIEFNKIRQYLKGTLMRGPAEQYEKNLSLFADEVESDGKRGIESSTDPEKFGASASILELKDFDFHVPEENHNTAFGLNPAQQAAYDAALDQRNPMVLIQGPPGTGKTHLLEQILRGLNRQGNRILVSAPSHAAVDNVCRRITDLPLLRCGRNQENIDPSLIRDHWLGTPGAYRTMAARCVKRVNGIIFAGTAPGLLRDRTVAQHREGDGIFDVLLLDEAGMCCMDETLLIARMAKRIIMLGDHRQLPPFPRPPEVIDGLNKVSSSRGMEAFATRSVLEWLCVIRKFPVFRLNTSYRCQNPRLLRFASAMFYGVSLLPNKKADYYKLPFYEREKVFPPETLCFISTSGAAAEKRKEQLVLSDGKPGIINEYEAELCVKLVRKELTRHPIEEIAILSPYRRQILLIRAKIEKEFNKEIEADPERWNRFLQTRISTVDSFQGGESDLVIITYVRSNPNRGIGFTDNPNRVNVAYTRCRRELVIIGDLDCLTKQEHNQLFERMFRAIRTDGVIVNAQTVEKAFSK